MSYMATPHARGSTRPNSEIKSNNRGYPACAGIDLFRMINGTMQIWLPRMRGDRPYFLGDESR